MSEQPRPLRRAVFAGLALLAMAGFLALGVWQVERRAWKHALVAAVDARIHATPVAAPGPAQWRDLTGAHDAYRRVRIAGRFRHDRETLVQALTDRGAGFWVLTPLETPAFTVLVNRGFVPPDKRSPASRAVGNVGGAASVTGLLRVSEPEGGFLRRNDIAADRWYSRDVTAIAAARGLEETAPYFIDADATPNPGGYPAGGLTVVRFPDNHLAYALTWFVLALLSGWGARQFLRKGPDRPHRP